MHRHAGQFRAGAHSVQGAAADHKAIDFGHQEAPDLPLKQVPGALHQGAGVLQRADHRHDVRHVPRFRLAHQPAVVRRDLGAHAFGGEQFRQQGAVVLMADQLAAGHAAAHGPRQHRQMLLGGGRGGGRCQCTIQPRRSEVA